jgi:hypothetical protein
MLADRNKQLEKELHDIDQMALAVEAECNSTVKENSMRVSKIQVRKKFQVLGQRRSIRCINQLILCTTFLSCYNKRFCMSLKEVTVEIVVFYVVLWCAMFWRKILPLFIGFNTEMLVYDHGTTT